MAKKTSKASKKPTMKSRASKVGAKVAKTGKAVGHKMAETGKKVGGAVGHGAMAAKDKTVAAFGSLRQRVRGKDEEE